MLVSNSSWVIFRQKRRVVNNVLLILVGLRLYFLTSINSISAGLFPVTNSGGSSYYSIVSTDGSSLLVGGNTRTKNVRSVVLDR